MEHQIATFGADGQFVLPMAVKEELGIQAGSQYEISVRNQEIVLQPINTASEENTADIKPIERLRAMLAGGPSLEDELLEWRSLKSGNVRFGI